MSAVDVLAVLDELIDFEERHAEYERRANYEAREARDAVAELIACSAVTIRAFERLGTTNGIVDQLESHRECERALVEQKAALARAQGYGK